MPKNPYELASTHSAKQEGRRASVIGGISVLQPEKHMSEKLRKKFSSYSDAQREASTPSASPPQPAEPEPKPPQLEALELDSGYIAFSGGVPVGGNAHLSLFPNGAYSSTGHFHDSGTPSYDMEMAWAVRSSTGTVFTFAHKGRVHGTL